MGLEKTGGGFRGKEEVGIHVTSKVVVYVIHHMKRRRVALLTPSLQKVALLWDFLAIEVKFEFCCLQAVGLTLPWGGRSVRKRERGREGHAAPQG